MTDNIKTFPKAVPPQPDPGPNVNTALVATMKDVLAAVEAGAVTNFIGLLIGPDGRVSRVRMIHDKGVNYYTLRGMLDWMKDDFCKSQEPKI